MLTDIITFLVLIGAAVIVFSGLFERFLRFTLFLIKLRRNKFPR